VINTAVIANSENTPNAVTTHIHTHIHMYDTILLANSVSTNAVQRSALM